MVNIHDYTKGKFETYSGIEIDILNPTIDMICIEDIAYGLANICRFGGQIDNHYSVAKHSIYVARLCPDLPPNDLKLVGLMHDASEAYLGDVVKPIKHLFGKMYSELEERYMRLIFEKYNLDYDKLALIKKYDKIALEEEQQYFRRDSRTCTVDFINHINGTFWGNTRGTAAIFIHQFKIYQQP